MARVILHIGDSKCGSSAIQSALFEGRERLEEQGLLYRAAHPTGGHFGFVTLAGVATRGDDERQRDELQAVISALRARLAQGGISHLILSAENFLVMAPGTALGLVRTIAPDIEGIDVVAYLREPAGWYLSHVQQTLKGSHRLPRPEDFKRPIDDFLLAWARAPGVDSLTVRVFDRARLAGGSVVTDFAALLSGLTGRQVELRDVEANISLTAEQMVVLQRFRARSEAGADGRLTPATSRLIALFQALNRIAPAGAKPRLQPRWETFIRSRAAQRFRRLDTRFPGLGALVEGVEAHRPPPKPPSRAHDVRSVIEPVDEELVRLLQQILPAFRQELLSGLPPVTQRALLALQSRYGLAAERVARPLRNYWTAAGAEAAARVLPQVIAVAHALHTDKGLPRAQPAGRAQRRGVAP